MALKLSDGEKLILVMLAEVHKELKIRDNIDPDLVLSAIFNKSTFGLEWTYSSLFGAEGETPPEVVTEVVDILDMWSFLESGYRELSDEDRQHIADAVPYGGKNVIFPGFDGNNETDHFGAARFLVNDLGRWGELKGRSLNSHSESLPRYRAMLRVFTPIRATLEGPMSADQIITVLKRGD